MLTPSTLSRSNAEVLVRGPDLINVAGTGLAASAGSPFWYDLLGRA